MKSTKAELYKTLQSQKDVKEERDLLVYISIALFATTVLFWYAQLSSEFLQGDLWLLRTVWCANWTTCTQAGRQVPKIDYY